MKRILVLFHPLNKVFKYLEKEGSADFAPHHFWFFDKLVEHGFEVDFMQSDDTTLLNRFGEKIRINFLQQQIDAILKAKDYDLIFFPYMEYSFVFNLLKVLKLFKKPVLGIAHMPYSLVRKNPLKNAHYNAVRYIYFKGMDSILFYSQGVMKKSKESKISGNCKFIDHFGVDFDFFERFRKSQLAPPKAQYLYATGGSNRDFNTLVQAFNGLDFDLRITTTGEDIAANLPSPIPENVFIDHSLPFGLGSTGKIRKEYYNALAVAVPLQENQEYRYGTYGLTVVLEGMAMGKPILSTYNPTYNFDIEKEKVGFWLDYNDVNGWRQAIRYLIEHPDQTREMGERAIYLCKTKYNYSLCANEVIKEIEQILQLKRQTQATEEKKPAKSKANAYLYAPNLLAFVDLFLKNFE